MKKVRKTQSSLFLILFAIMFSCNCKAPIEIGNISMESWNSSTIRQLQEIHRIDTLEKNNPGSPIGIYGCESREKSIQTIEELLIVWLSKRSFLLDYLLNVDLPTIKSLIIAEAYHCQSAFYVVKINDKTELSLQVRRSSEVVYEPLKMNNSDGTWNSVLDSKVWNHTNGFEDDVLHFLRMITVINIDEHSQLKYQIVSTWIY